MIVPELWKSALCLTAISGLLIYGSPQYVFAADNYGPANQNLDNAQMHFRAKEFDRAIVCLNKAIGSYDLDAKPYMLRGECHFNLGHYDLAIGDFNRVLELSPNHFAAFLWRGTAHAKLGTDDLAIKDYEQAIRLNHRLAVRYFNAPGLKAGKQQGSAVIAMERFHLPGVLPENRKSPAIRDYKEAMRIVYPNGFSASAATRAGDANPGTYATDADDAAYLTQVSAGAEGDNGAAAGSKPSKVSAVAVIPGHDQPIVDDSSMPRQGKKHLRGRVSDASDSTKGAYQALAADPAKSNATNIEGNLDVGRSDDTLDARKNRRVVNRFGQDQDFGEFGAVPGSQPMKGDPDTVIKRCTEAIRQDDRNAEYFYLRAKAFQKLARVNDAYRDYSRAIELDPSVAKYLIGRASLFHQLNKPLLVDADVKRALDVDQELPHNIHFGGEFYPSTVKWSGDGPGGN